MHNEKYDEKLVQNLGRTPHATHTTVPTSACANDSVRRSKRTQHGESMPHERDAGCRPLYCDRTPRPGGREGGIAREQPFALKTQRKGAPRARVALLAAVEPTRTLESWL